MTELNPLSPPLTPEQIEANRETWLRELESGKWKQFRGMMRNNACDSFCCIGVIEALFFDTEHAKRWPPYEEVCAAVGMTDSGMSRCIQMNDAEGKSFPEIAHAIRSDPSAFFAPLPKAEA